MTPMTREQAFRESFARCLTSPAAIVRWEAQARERQNRLWVAQMSVNSTPAGLGTWYDLGPLADLLGLRPRDVDIRQWL